MNIVNKLTLRHMLLNKRRTMVTIAGVIISVAMITSVAILGVSFLDLFKRESIASIGNWHMKFYNTPASKLDVLKESKYADELLLEHEAGYALLTEQGVTEGSSTKKFIHVREYNTAAFDKLPLKLLDGRLPTNEHEIVVPEHYVKRYSQDGLVIGSTMTMTLGQRVQVNEEGEQIFLDQGIGLMVEEDKLLEQFVPKGQASYTIVGIIERLDWEYVSSPGYSFLTYLNEANLTDDQLVTASLYSAKPDKGIFQESERLAKELDSKPYTTNGDLLRYQFVSMNGGFIITMYSLMAIVMGVIIIGSVSLIYNAFGISVADRSRYLGMLASVGATRRQKRNSVLFEGLVISIISIPLGILAALAGLGITFAAINSTIKDVLSVSVGLELKMNLGAALLAVAVSLITIFLSTWWPAKRASKVSAIDAIRQSQDVKLTRKQLKTSRLIRKLFGMEADIAMKNIKRNKRRYQITVFSLVVSIMLFLTVSYLTTALKTTVFSTSEGINYDLKVSYYDAEEPNVDMIASLEGVKEYNQMDIMYTNVQLPVELLPEQVLKAKFGEDPHNETVGMPVFFYQLEDDKLLELADKAGINADRLLDADRPQAIVYNISKFYNPVDKRFVYEAALLKTSDIELQLRALEYIQETNEAGEESVKEQKIDMGSIELVGSTKSAPIGMVHGGKSGPEGVALIVSESAMSKLKQHDNMNKYESGVYLTSDDPNKLEEDLREIEQLESFYISNKHKSKQVDDATLFIVSVFSYGFISLITLISIANILNTISTSIALRKREFAMLRSIGMTEKGFYRMINYESLLYGLKALLYGLPLSFGIMLLIYNSVQNTTTYRFEVPWFSIVIMIVALFMIVGLSMIYSGSKVKKGSIVEAIKQDNL
ncbi:ABC transporter permease [Paenibacillus montaniterrae]|uniref:ABC transporter permease n=1 Tax=Paenibacillus montaniterrae TaxID=429341 RepID=A0A920CVV0_9BACL|nr:ABC transporter permease [Paenibacillus montaniterrae]GIP18577.1 ABC transporter permease [Paenibacillus montaniterrae]